MKNVYTLDAKVARDFRDSFLEHKLKYTFPRILDAIGNSARKGYSFVDLYPEEFTLSEEHIEQLRSMGYTVQFRGFGNMATVQW